MSEICLRWLENRTINPRSGKRINIEGSIYKALQDECAEYMLALTSRKREELIQQLEGECYNNEDPISLEQFSELSENKLATIIKIGNGSKKHCIELNNMYQLIKNSLEQHRIPMNPFTREDLSLEDVVRVYNSMKVVLSEEAIMFSYGPRAIPRYRELRQQDMIENDPDDVVEDIVMLNDRYPERRQLRKNFPMIQKRSQHPSVVQTARQLYSQHPDHYYNLASKSVAELIAKHTYDLPPEVIVAIWKIVRQ